MATLEKTTRRYHGRLAETYDAKRARQRRWHVENEVVARMLGYLHPRSVLDCPVGTGRFLKTYALLNVSAVVGIDASKEMLALARKKVPRSMKQHAEVDLFLGDASAIDASDALFDVVVCVRFLDLLDAHALDAVMRELCRVARRAVILTIRLGDEYFNKSNTATHHRRRFNALIKRLGWRVAESVPVLNAGWVIMRLER